MHAHNKKPKLQGAYKNNTDIRYRKLNTEKDTRFGCDLLDFGPFLGQNHVFGVIMTLMSYPTRISHKSQQVWSLSVAVMMVICKRRASLEANDVDNSKNARY